MHNKLSHIAGAVCIALEWKKKENWKNNKSMLIIETKIQQNNETLTIRGVKLNVVSLHFRQVHLHRLVELNIIFIQIF